MRSIHQPRAVITREKILRAAAGLFALKGYHHTSLVEVRREAQVSTGAFFHHFADKEDLGFTVLKRHMEKRRQELDRLEEAIPLAPNADPVALLFRRLDAVAQMIVNRGLLAGGCVIGNLSASLSDTHEAFRNRLAECFEEMALEFQPHLEQALKRPLPLPMEEKGEKAEKEENEEKIQLDRNARGRADAMDSKPDARALARYIVAVIEGTILLARTCRDPRLVTIHFESLKQQLQLALKL